MRQVIRIASLGIVAICLIGLPGQAQTSLLRSDTGSRLPTTKPYSVAGNIKRRVDSLQRMTQHGYYSKLFATKNRPNARLAASPCDSYLCTTPTSPALSISLTASGMLTCKQPQVTLTVTGAPASSTYVFSTGAGQPSGLSSSTATITTGGPYSVTVTAPGGSTATAQTKVQVDQIVPSVSLAASGTLSCTNTTVTLTATGAPANSTYIFSAGAIQSVGPLRNTATVSASTLYSVTAIASNGCSASATTSVSSNTAPPALSLTPPSATLCTGQTATLTASGGNTYRWNTGPTSSTLLVSYTGTYSVTAVNTNGCSATAAANITVNQLPTAPSLLTQSGQTYAGAQASVTVLQNSGTVNLVVNGCNGMVNWTGSNNTSGMTNLIPVLTNQVGMFVYSATCQVGGCTSPPASVTVTVKAVTFSVFHQDADRNLANNTIKPYLQLQNDDTSPIPYGELTVRYWLTVEQFTPLTNMSVYYAQLGTNNVKMRYVALAQPRQGAFGYVEYSFDTSAGSLGAGSNSGPVQTGIGKQDWTNVNEADDYSYASNSNYTKNSRITAYRNGTLIWGTEPAGVASVQSLKPYTENKSGATTNAISTYLQLRNEGNVPVNYSDVKVRYYLTADGSQPLNFYLDYAVLGNSNVKGQFVRPNPPLANADTYLELSFTGSLGTMYPLSNTGTIQYRIAKQDWSNFNQSNDHSYQNGSNPMSENSRVVVYVAGTRVYGTEPGAAARLAAEEPDTQLRVVLLGNPVQNNEVKVEVSGAQGQTLRYVLTDLNGRLVSERFVEQAGAVERQTLSLSGQPARQLLLRVSTSTQAKTVKIARTD